MTMQEKAARMLDETIDMLRHKDVRSTQLEHWFLLDEAWRQVEDLPQPLQEGEGLCYVLERCSLPVSEHDLLLGRFVDRVPTDEEEARFQALWQTGRPMKNPISEINGSHTTLDWGHLLAWGLPGYLERAARKLSERRDAGAAEEELVFLRGMTLVYRACLRYVARYGAAAAAAGQEELAAVCRALEEGPPRTFRQGLQVMLFVLNIYYLYIGHINSTLCYGRMDTLLLGLYEADLAAGRLTEADAGALIDDFYCKASLVLGRGEHQMADPSQGGHITGWDRSNVFDDPTYIVLGGYSAVRDLRQNPLTDLFLRHIHPRLENPVIIYRRTAQDPDERRDLVCDKLRQNASLLVYNDETMIPAMRHAGASDADAAEYTIHPCNWPDLPSYSVVMQVGGPIPGMIRSALVDETGALRRDFPTLEDLYRAVEEDFRQYLRRQFAAYRARYRSGPQAPSTRLSMTDCFTDGVIDAARGVYDGGVKYPAVYVLLRNIATAADMMAALEQEVYRTGRYTLSQIAAALADNFAADPVLRARLRGAPKFGTDDMTADRHAVALMTRLLDVVDEEAVGPQGERDVITLCVTITDMGHIYEGAQLGATPDGREAGTPLSENLSPTRGVGDSVTALLRSVARLPFDRLQAGAFNLRLQEALVRGDEGLCRLRTLTDAFFDEGGMQLQLTVADTATLRDAQVHPEDYADLMVRITGYSAVFVDMSRNAQEELIRRDELGA